MKLRSLVFQLCAIGIAVLFLTSAFAWQSQVQAQEDVASVTCSEVETLVVRTNGPNSTEGTPQPDPSLAEQSEEPQRVAPKQVYLIPVDGPNLTGKTPPLKMDTAIPLYEKGIDIATVYQSGQWYDHYAYYDLGGTEVEQYTNFQESTYGQYIWFQSWQNNNGGTDRWLKDGWTGSTYRAFYTWLNTTPTFNPGQEYTDGYGTRLQSYFQTSSSNCPCWLADYRVGTH